MINKRKSFNWEDYIAYGKNIYENYEDDEDEAMERSGISRAYYGAFHLTLSCLKNTRFYPNTTGESSHNAVIESCKKLGKIREDRNAKSWANLSTWLDRLKKQRKKVDYNDYYFSLNDPQPYDLKKELGRAISCAEDIKNTTEEIKKNEKE